ncbi:DUF4148 domain-containing protein [Paraburkholderia sp. 7MH5]|uniref:DUF4148 domain-containing protein n=1 Tax=Paraburkholderia pallida TaxID=2547399 RepID=A0A4P7D0Y3_9BURK|nr:DUF4148 domain-containing protein [Paraburkholderia pallida]
MVKNAILRTALVSMIAIVPAISFAQSIHNGPVTRAQVLQELADLESVGYNPAMGNEVNYPENVQAAMRRLEAKRASEARVAQQDLSQSGYGAQPVQTGDAGGPAAAGNGEPPAYLHH